MDIWTKNITSKFDRIQNKLQNILENEAELEKKQAFEPTQDSALLKGLHLELPQDLEDRAIVLFNRLSIFFNAGLFFERQFTQWKALASFSHGRAQILPKAAQSLITLPECSPSEVQKASAKNFLEKFPFDSSLHKISTAVLIRPAPQFAYILMSELPDLWLKDHVEKVHHEVLSGFAENPSIENLASDQCTP